ncbi:MAG TPA: hypothetical protein VH420_10385 [Gaiellaceae bacterium]|jgi:hypothetical protein
MNELTVPRDRDFPAGRLERRARHLVSELRPSRRRRLWPTLVPAIAILLVGATAFTAYRLTRDEPTVLESIGCYDRASLDANVAVVSPGAGGPVAACRRVWNQGAMEGPEPRRFAACVLSTGPIGVFPSTGSGTCAALGLADVSSRALAEARRFAALREAIFAKVGAPPSGLSRGSSLCLSEQSARRIVRQELDGRGYSDWTITTGGEPFSPERPCADVSFDGQEKAVVLLSGTR